MLGSDGFWQILVLTLIQTGQLCLAQVDLINGTAVPVLAIDFPDPSLIEYGGSWYAFSTNSHGKNIQVATSPSFILPQWRLLENHEVLPDPGPWAINHREVWAPDVVQLDDGTWVLYYAAEHINDTSKHCIGAATSKNVIGPYEPKEQPFACPLEQGGAIDAASFLDPRSGNLYVVYKIDGNSLNTGGEYMPTPIMLQMVSKSDGITHVGSPQKILDRGVGDGPLVEAPSLFYNAVSALYFLTFSSNNYATALYDISFAYSATLDREFIKARQPLMTTGMGYVTAPGGADMTPDGKYALYHGTVGFNGSYPIRHLYAAEAYQFGFNMTALPFPYQTSSHGQQRNSSSHSRVSRATILTLATSSTDQEKLFALTALVISWCLIS